MNHDRTPTRPLTSSRRDELLGHIDPAERVAHAFDEVDAVDDPSIFIRTSDRHLALAAIDPDLPLAGVTFAVKNSIDVAGFPTTAGCPSYAFDPSESAPVVQRLIDAGATCIGVTNLDQFATGLVGTRSPYGVPRNAIDPRLVPGGSSSGSAVAVARGLVDFSLGTDTAGSGRVPAAHNRIVGIKPTRGHISTRGVVPAVRSLDCVSVFGATVSMATLGYDACAGFDPLDAMSRRPGPVPMVPPTLRVGLPRRVELATSADEEAWHSSVEQLAALEYVEIVEVEIDDLIEAGNMLYDGPWVAERYAAVGRFLETGPADANPTVASTITGAKGRTAVEAYEAHYRLGELRRRSDQTWDRVDVLMVPTTPGVATLAEVRADPVGRNSALGTYTNWVNLLDQCAVAVPGVDRDDGWPFGVTFLAPAWADDTILDLSARYTGETLDPNPFANRGGIDIVVVGAHLEGQPLNWQLTEHGGHLVRSARTTSNYRLYALGGPGLAKPALVRVDDDDEPGVAAIEVEVWRLPASEVGAFTQYIPAPLGLGRVHLDDGTAPTGFIAEAAAMKGATDITTYGGWRSYLSGGE